MAILVSNTDRLPERDYATLYLRLCRCGGPQPSRTSPRSDEHLRDCPYRKEVEGHAEELP